VPTIIVNEGSTPEVEGAVEDVPTVDTEAGVPVTVFVVVEGMRTSDGRYITPGSLTHRALPLPILGLRTNTESGHTGAEVFGRIDTLTRVPGPDLNNRQTGQPFPEGTFVWVGTGSVRGEHALTEDMRAGYLTGNSVDLSEVEYDIIWPEIDESDPEAAAEAMAGGPDEIRFTSGVIAGTTVCPFPAFAEAYIELDGNPISPAADVTGEPLVASVITHEAGDALVASADGDDDLPPAAWFADPGLPGPTRLTVNSDGEIVGHLATWGVRHVGFDGREVYAPRSRTGYAEFMRYDLTAVDGDGQPVDVQFGHLTMGGGHADTGLDSRSAAAHYDDACTRVARVAVGEDEFGIWVHGQVRPELTLRERRDLAESQISGDWRRIGGSLELVAALAVNSPGFPVPRSRVASASVQSLVAAGAMPRSSGAVVLDYDTLADAIADRLDARGRARADALRERQRSARLAMRRADAVEALR
jgi:hypothetical protein